MNPQFSIIIPLYNKEKDIKTTLESVLAQSFTNFEIIVANDGSTDASEEVVKRFTDTRIKYFNKKNEGVGPTRNFAVKGASAEHIAFLDADDYWYPNHLENLDNLIKKFPDCKWFATAYEKKHNQKLTIATQSPIMQKCKNWMGIVEDYFQNSFVDSLAWTSAVCFRKDFFEKLGGFDIAITNGAGEDTDLWIRAALESEIAVSTKITAQYNLVGSNRISHIPTKNRVFMNPDTYINEEKNNPTLKKYLDLNRYSFALQHKMAGDMDAFKKYKAGINDLNITSKQRFLLNLPSWVLFKLVKYQKIVADLGFRVSSF